MGNNFEILENMQTYQFYQGSEAYKRYIEHENSTKEEELKTKALLCKIKDFNNKVLNKDFKNICSSYRKFGYINNEGYYAVIPYEEEIYRVIFLGDDVNQAFQYLIVDILLQNYEMSEEEKEVISTKNSIFANFIVNDFCKIVIKSFEFALSTWQKYTNDNPVENDNVIKYLEKMANNDFFIKDSNVEFHYDDEQGKFIFTKKAKSR